MTSPLLINEPPLQVSPALAWELGLNEAIVLQQIHYWLNLQFSRCLYEDRYWVRYAPKQWECQFPFWNQKNLRRIIRNLEKRGALTSHHTRDSCNTKYYIINYQTLSKATSSSKSRSEQSLLLSTYDHASLNAINFDEAQRSIQ